MHSLFIKNNLSLYGLIVETKMQFHSYFILGNIDGVYLYFNSKHCMRKVRDADVFDQRLQ